MFFFHFPLCLFLTKFFFSFFNDFADNHSTKPQLSLDNRVNLDRILRSEVYVNEADSPLRVAHLILGYTPISRAFQAPKCVIKAKDPRLHRINVAYEGFVVSEGIPIPEGTPLTQPLFMATPSIGASSSQPVLQEEEEGEEKEEEQEEQEEENPEGIVTLSESLEEFEVFNQPPSSGDISANLDSQQQGDITTFDKMSIQRKNQKSLMDLIESQLGRDALRKSAQPKLPPPPPKSPLPPPQPPVPHRPDPADPKRKREQKGKEIVETGRSRST